MSTALISIGARALFANYAALQTVGNNIANANTPGYSRQSVELSTAAAQFSGAGFFGKGVDVATVTRAHSELLTRELNAATAISAADQMRASQLQRLEGVFATGEAGLGFAASQFLNAFVDVANNPQDNSARQVVLSRAGTLAQQFRTAGDKISDLQGGVVQDLGVAVSSLNTLAKGVAELNRKIADALGQRHPPNDLLDQRDEMIRKMSELVQVTTVASNDGSVSVFIGGGQRLVLGDQAARMTLVADKFDPARVGVALVEAGKTIPLSAGIVATGKIGALLRFQNSDLVDARNLLGQLAQALSHAVNEQQALGLGLGQPAAAGAPMFATGALRVAPGAGNAKAGGVDVASFLDAGGVRVPSVSITIVDASQLQASDYELLADPAGSGTYQLTRLRDGLVQTVAAGDVVDGVRIDAAGPLPMPGDRFLLQSVGNAASHMQLVLGDPRGIAAAAPVTATLGGANGSVNTGTASVASLRAVDTSLDASLSATLTFTSASGDYDWELRDASNAVVSNGSATWQAGTPIALNGWELQLDGVPASGDGLSVRKTLFPAANNGNARALADLRGAALVAVQAMGSAAAQAGATVTDAYANAMTDIAVRVQGARISLQMSTSASAAAKAANDDVAGVNLDEEAARLIQYQQSYQAAAKLLQVAQTVFDALLNTGKL
ncbi:MAG: flagellar hook-associated protein FlgK [Burkholderiaceae bacterium]